MKYLKRAEMRALTPGFGEWFSSKELDFIHTKTGKLAGARYKPLSSRHITKKDFIEALEAIDLKNAAELAEVLDVGKRTAERIRENPTENYTANHAYKLEEYAAKKIWDAREGCEEADQTLRELQAKLSAYINKQPGRPTGDDASAHENELPKELTEELKRAQAQINSYSAKEIKARKALNLLKIDHPDDVMEEPVRTEFQARMLLESFLILSDQERRALLTILTSMLSSHIGSSDDEFMDAFMVRLRLEETNAGNHVDRFDLIKAIANHRVLDNEIARMKKSGWDRRAARSAAITELFQEYLGEQPSSE